MLILLVEDNRSDGLLVRAMLKKLGYDNVHEASNGADALRRVKTATASVFKYDLIITDWNMPEMSGLDLLSELRSQKKTSTTPIILLTGVTDVNQVKAAIEKGATDYIVKPVVLETLKAKLEKIFSSP